MTPPARRFGALLTLSLGLAGCESFLTPVPDIQAPNDSTVCAGLPVPEQVAATIAGAANDEGAVQVTLAWSLDGNFGIGVERSVDGAIERLAFEGSAGEGTDFAPTDSQVTYRVFSTLQGCPDGPAAENVQIITPPLQPTLTVSFDEDDVILSWQDYSASTIPVTFDLLRVDAAGTETVLSAAAAGGTTEFRDGPVPDETSFIYTLVVRQSDAPMGETRSPPLTVTTRPMPVTGLSSEPGANGVLMFWNDSSFAADYVVRFEPVSSLGAEPFPTLAGRPAATEFQPSNSVEVTLSAGNGFPVDASEVLVEIVARSASGAPSAPVQLRVRTVRAPTRGVATVAVAPSLNTGFCELSITDYAVLDPLTSFSGATITNATPPLGTAVDPDASVIRVPILPSTVLPDVDELPLQGSLSVNVDDAAGSTSPFTFDIDIYAEPYLRLFVEAVGGEARQYFAPGRQPFRVGGEAPGSFCMKCNDEEPGQVAVGDDHGCVIERGGTVRCWGAATQRGNNNDATAASSQVCADASCTTLLTEVEALTAGANHTCAIAGSQRRVYCWGASTAALGTGSNTAPFAQPVTESLGGMPLDGIDTIDAGGATTCAARVGTGAVLCWGDNTLRQVGDGTTTSPPFPTPVCAPTDLTAVNCVNTPLISARQVAVGTRFACALIDTADDNAADIFCWGDNEAGQLQNSSRQTAADWGYALAMCGEAPASETECPGTPSQVVLGRAEYETVAIAVGRAHACAIVNVSGVSVEADGIGRLYCWGENRQRQLGRSTDSANLPPEPAIFASDTPPITWESVAAVDLAGNLTCAVRSDDPALYCFGRGIDNDQVDGFRAQKIGPNGGPEVDGHAISISSDFGCALGYLQAADQGQGERPVRCFGDNSVIDRLGRGSLSNTYLQPAPVCDNPAGSGQCVPFGSARMRACAELTEVAP